MCCSNWKHFYHRGVWNTIVYFHMWQCSLVFSSWHNALRLSNFGLRSCWTIWIHYKMATPRYRVIHLQTLAMTWSWKWKQQVISYNVQGNEILATSLGPLLCTLMAAWSLKHRLAVRIKARSSSVKHLHLMPAELCTLYGQGQSNVVP